MCSCCPKEGRKWRFCPPVPQQKKGWGTVFSRRYFRIVKEGEGFRRLNCVVLKRVRGAVAEVIWIASAENDFNLDEELGRIMAMASLYRDQGECDCM
jgi:hypothetical protein